MRPATRAYRAGIVADGTEPLLLHTRDENAAVTFVIVHCRGYADLSACLESIEQCETPSDVLVIDHAFSAERLKALAQRFAWVRFIAEPSNPGFAAAVNRGSATAPRPTSP